MGEGVCLPQAAPVRPAPGERTISNAEVPLPRSPLSLAGGTAHREPLPVGFAANRRFSPRGCKGRSPLHKNNLSLPLPHRGRGGIGGGRKKGEGRVGGQGRRHTPRRARGSLPVPVPPPAQARGCKGRSPLHEITLIPPLPAGKGVRGMGAEKQAKGMAGGRGRRRTLHLDSCVARSVSAAGGLMPGCRGRSPRRNKVIFSPFPAGRGLGGIGERNQAKGRIGGRGERQAPRGCRNGRGGRRPPPLPPRRGQRAAGSFPPRCAPSPFCTNPAAIFGTGCGLTGAAETYIIGRETFDDSEAP